MRNSRNRPLTLISVFLLVCSMAAPPAGRAQRTHSGAPCDGLQVRVHTVRVVPGDTVAFTVVSDLPLRLDQLEVVLIQPRRGIQRLAITAETGHHHEFTGMYVLPDDGTDGIYGITAIASDGETRKVGKAVFLSGNVIADFAILSGFADQKRNTVSDIHDYFRQFLKAGGNGLILHANMAALSVGGDSMRVRALWASEVCRYAVKAPDDRIEMMLAMADTFGLPSLISVTWDRTDPSLPNTRYMASMHAITAELWTMFCHHPSLVGFYDYQEGSGTYYANHIREFCSGVKRHNRGLLTMCAPYLDDPLLAGYLSAIDDLDIINYQSPIMTSYRPDNRQLYPNRRAKDITSLSAGATRVRNKITLSHVELMGYFENKLGDSYLTGHTNIFDQFLTLASSYGPDGTTLFTYSYHVCYSARTFPAESRQVASGVTDGVKAYDLISKMTADQSSHIAVYIPYSDWCIERWTHCITPATDAFRRLGFSPEIIPFVPPKGEDILPYYPMHANSEQLDFLLRNKYVLVLPDISGMQDTDSEMLEAFVRTGGVVIAFGPRIPYGDRFDRNALWGAQELTPIQAHHTFEQLRLVRSPGARTTTRDIFRFGPVVSTSWKPADGQTIGAFEDGSAAVFTNRYHHGRTYVVSFSLHEAVSIFPGLVRDLLDEALQEYGEQRPFDVYGMNEDMDVSMSSREGSGCLTLTNYGSGSVTVTITPLFLDHERWYTVTDMSTGNVIAQAAGTGFAPFTVQVDGNTYRTINVVPKGRQ